MPSVENQGTDPVATAVEAPPLELSLLDLLVVLRRHRRLIVSWTLGLALLGLLLASVMAKSYTATTDFLPPQQGGGASALLSQLGGLGSLAGLATGGASSALKNPSDLYVGLMKSETVETAMIRRFDLQKEFHEKLMSVTAKKLEEITKFDTTGKDGLIRISVTEKSPERAAELANGWIEEYRKLSANLAIGEASQRRMFLSQQVEQAKTTLAASEEDLKKLEQTSGMIQLDSQARALIESVASLRAQITAKEVQIQSMETYSGNGNPDLVQSQQELSSLRAQLAKLGAKENGATDSDMISTQGRLPQTGLEYLRKTRDVRYNETLFEFLARQYEAAKLDEAREGALIQVVDKAYPPDYKSGPKRGLFLVVGFLSGLMLSCGFVLGREFLRYLRQQPEWIAKMGSASRGA